MFDFPVAQKHLSRKYVFCGRKFTYECDHSVSLYVEPFRFWRPGFALYIYLIAFSVQETHQLICGKEMKKLRKWKRRKERGKVGGKNTREKMKKKQVTRDRYIGRKIDK